MRNGPKTPSPAVPPSARASLQGEPSSERAEWRPRPGDPRSLLGVYFGRDRLLGLPVGLCLAVYTASVLLVSMRLSHGFGLMFLFATLMPVISGRKEYRAPEAGPRRGPRRTLAQIKAHPLGALVTNRLDGVADLVPLPSPDAFYGVEITLRNGETFTGGERIAGGDLGVVAFSEGWLVYEGLGVAFSLCRADVRKSWPGTPNWTLDLSDEQRLTLQSYDAGWAKAIHDWMNAPSTAGRSRLPPLEPSPIRRPRPAGYLHLAASMVGGSAVAAWVAPAGVRDTFLLGTLALILWLSGAFAAAWSRRARRRGYEPTRDYPSRPHR